MALLINMRAAARFPGWALIVFPQKATLFMPVWSHERLRRLTLPRPWGNAAGFALAVGLAIALAAMPGNAKAQANPPPVAADPPDSPLKNLFKLGNFATDPAPPKDFVIKSRPVPDQQNYLPVHERPVTRPEKIYTPAQAKAKEAELDQVRFAHDRLANRPSAALTAPPGSKAGSKKIKLPKP